MIPRLLTATFVSANLIACGGGGSSTPTAPNPDLGGNNPSQSRLSAQVMSSNICGATRPQQDAVLIVHNSDFTTLSTHQADGEGRFAINLDEETVTVSLVSRTTDSTMQEAVSVDTFVDIPVMDLGKFTKRVAIENDSDCECVQTDVSLRNSIETVSPSDFALNLRNTSFTNVSARSNGAIFQSVDVCRSVDGQWPYLSGTLEYGFLGDRAYWGSLDEFEPAQALEIEVNALAQDVPINVDFGDSAGSTVVRTYGRLRGVQHHLIQPLGVGASVPIATDPNMETYVVDAATIDFNRGVLAPLTNDFLLNIARKDYTQVPSSTVDLAVLDEEAFIQATLQTFGDTDSYDYSANPSADIFRFFTQIEAEDGGEILYWRISGPITGNLAGIDNFSLDGVDFVVNNTSQRVATEAFFTWSIEDLEAAQGYHDYLALEAQASTSDSAQQKSERTIVIAGSTSDFDSPVGKNGVGGD